MFRRIAKLAVLLVLGSVAAAEEPAKPSTAKPSTAGQQQKFPPVPSIADLWREPAIPVGLQKQLLTDDHVISHRHNIHRDLNPMTKANDGKPVLVRDKPWEQANLFQVQAVRREGDKFVMHYGYVGPVDYCCRAESADGIHWAKPNLGLREFGENKENNLLDYQGVVAFLDPHEADPAHKYKSLFRPLESGKLPHAACLAHSADGLHWEAYNGGEPVTGRAADTLSQLVWDERTKLYRLFTRTDFGGAGGETEVRGAREMTNPDVKGDPTNWTTVRNWIFDREGPGEVKRRQIHTVNFWQHEGIDFGLMVVMEWPAFNIPQVDASRDKRRHERDVWNVYLATRRGGHASDWDLSWIYAEKPLIPRGGEGAFDKDILHNAPSIVTEGDQHWLYYTGWPNGHMRHPYLPAIGLATLPLDRFVYLEPWKKKEGGWIITKPFKVEGNQLELNADASEGSVVAEILDEEGDPLPRFTKQDFVPLEKADGIRLIPRWKNQIDLSPLLGKTVRLKIYLERARLFAFQIRKVSTTGKSIAEPKPINAEHVKVYQEKGRFGGWPANHGIWSWGDEILVGFSAGYHKDRGPIYHNIDHDKPEEHLLARSLDGGKTWSIENPARQKILIGTAGMRHGKLPTEFTEPEPIDCPGGIDFRHPDFAMTCRMAGTNTGVSRFYYSNDRGRSWQGPFKLPLFEQQGIAARTDYLVNGPEDCMVFLTASKSNNREGRPLCGRTTDGGKTWKLVSLIGPEPKGYSIMPSTVRLSETELLTTIRCLDQGQQPKSWIEAWSSADNGSSWSLVNKPVPDTGEGNPPQLLLLRDGRLCLTYGYRAKPFSILARLSSDQGKTWDDAIVLRGDCGGQDLGYCRSVQRPDGKVVTLYYMWDEKTGPERYIGATIWLP